MKGGKAKRTREEMAHSPPSCPVNTLVGLTEEGERVVKKAISEQINLPTFQMIAKTVPSWKEAIAEYFQGVEDKHGAWDNVWAKMIPAIRILLYGRDMPVQITPGLDRKSVV